MGAKIAKPAMIEVEAWLALANDELSAVRTASGGAHLLNVAEDNFLLHVESFTLNSWDHYTHIRLGWIVIHRVCVTEKRPFQEAFERVAELTSNFLANSEKLTNGETYHCTMAYFWCHMIAHQMQLHTLHGGGDGNGYGVTVADVMMVKGGAFFAFLNSLRESYAVDLCNTTLIEGYYSNAVLFGNEAKAFVVQPDLQPLPVLSEW